MFLLVVSPICNVGTELSNLVSYLIILVLSLAPFVFRLVLEVLYSVSVSESGSHFPRKIKFARIFLTTYDIFLTKRYVFLTFSIFFSIENIKNMHMSKYSVTSFLLDGRKRRGEGDELGAIYRSVSYRPKYII